MRRHKRQKPIDHANKKENVKSIKHYCAIRDKVLIIDKDVDNKARKKNDWPFPIIHAYKCRIIISIQHNGVVENDISLSKIKFVIIFIDWKNAKMKRSMEGFLMSQSGDLATYQT